LYRKGIHIIRVVFKSNFPIAENLFSPKAVIRSALLIKEIN